MATHQDLIALQAIAHAIETATPDPPDKTAPTITIEQFRARLTHAPAGNGDHRFHTPRHFLPRVG